jgi:hypothetical protein
MPDHRGKGRVPLTLSVDVYLKKVAVQGRVSTSVVGPQGTKQTPCFKMKALIYNICGFGQVGQRTQLRNYVRRERLDLIGLQETIKHDFLMAELRSLECGGQFVWN